MTYLILLLSLVAFSSGQPQKPMQPAADPTGPKWQGVLKLSDGRTFVTDGGLAIDAALAKPDSLPTRTVSAKILEDYMAAKLPTEVGLSELSKGIGAKNYSAPNGISLNPIYIDYLRRTLPAARVKLRMGKPLEPIPIVLDGKPVGVLMALAPAKQ